MTKDIERPPPKEVLLDRQQVPEQIAEDLEPYVSHLATLSDYGVQLLKRSFHASPREVPDLVVLGTVYRQVLAFLDSVYIHLEEGAVHAAIPSLRALFEATLALEWILKGPSSRKEDQAAWKERWARQFYVSELRQDRSWNQGLIPGTSEHAKLSKVAGDLVSKVLNDPEKAKAVKQRVASTDAHIANHPELKRINGEFAKHAKPGQEPPWYKPGGPSSISDMASKLGHADMYQILYRRWSEVAHGSRTKGHLSMGPNRTIIFEPIRTIEHLDQVLALAASFGERATILIVDEYRPGDPFKEKLARDWKDRRRGPEIVVNTVLVDTPYP